MKKKSVKYVDMRTKPAIEFMKYLMKHHPQPQSLRATRFFHESFLPGGINESYREEIMNDPELLKLNKLRKKKRRSNAPLL